MVAKVFHPENRLAGIFGGPGASFANDLVAAAETRVDALHDRLADAVHEAVCEMELLGLRSEELVFADCREISAIALQVAEIAGSAGLHGIGETARGIRAMIESLFAGGVWHSDALRLHFEALQLLARGAVGPEEEAAMLKRLRGMRERVGAYE